MFNLIYHLFGKELFIRFTVRVFREQLSIFMCVLPSVLVLRVGCGIRLYQFLIIAFLSTRIFNAGASCVLLILMKEGKGLTVLAVRC